MPRSLPRTLSWLPALLAAGGLMAAPGPRPAPRPRPAPQAWRNARARQTQRAAKALAAIAATKADLGLGPADELRPSAVFTDDLGQTHLRLQQLHHGVRVWGGDLVAHVDLEGDVLPATGHAVKGLDLDPTPGIPADRARALALKHLGVPGDLTAEPKVELVVYPNPGGPRLALTWDKAKRRFVADPVHTVLGRREEGSHLLAYHVHAEVSDPKGGVHQEDLILDAKDGLIVDRWNALPTDTPVKAVGHSGFSGTVSLDANQSASGYQLMDTARNRLTVVDAHGNATSYPTYHPTTGVYGIAAYDLMGYYNWPYGQHLLYESATADFGNGSQPSYFGYAPASDPAEQTGGVDALFGVQNAWDFYLNVLNREGIDGFGTPPYVRVHWWQPNAYWSDTDFALTLGDRVENDSSVTPFATVDIVGHELSHGVTANTSGFIYSGEAGGLNEGTSDIFGTMAEFYQKGAGGAGSSVPDTGGDWVMGGGMINADNPEPIRWMDHPSLDGASPDAWFYGIAVYDPHYASGPLNRMFYFLSQGADAATGDHHSDFVPGGFPGIGNDAATRIWYRALSVYLTPTASYHNARSCALLAAGDLYPGDESVQAAVENAFAAINVGAAHGEAPRPLVTLADSGSVLGPFFAFTSAGDTARAFSATVQNSADTQVDWTAPDGGVIGPDGTYTAPIRAGGWLYRIEATSHADALERAQGFAYSVNLDLDDDAIQDASDMANLALHYRAVYPTPDYDGRDDLFFDFVIDDLDVAAYVEAFNRTYGR